MYHVEGFGEDLALQGEEMGTYFDGREVAVREVLRGAPAYDFRGDRLWSVTDVGMLLGYRTGKSFSDQVYRVAKGDADLDGEVRRFTGLLLGDNFRREAEMVYPFGRLERLDYRDARVSRRIPNLITYRGMGLMAGRSDLVAQRLATAESSDVIVTLSTESSDHPLDRVDARTEVLLGLRKEVAELRALVERLSVRAGDFPRYTASDMVRLLEPLHGGVLDQVRVGKWMREYSESKYSMKMWHQLPESGLSLAQWAPTGGKRFISYRYTGEFFDGFCAWLDERGLARRGG